MGQHGGCGNNRMLFHQKCVCELEYYQGAEFNSWFDTSQGHVCTQCHRLMQDCFVKISINTLSSRNKPTINQPINAKEFHHHGFTQDFSSALSLIETILFVLGRKSALSPDKSILPAFTLSDYYGHEVRIISCSPTQVNVH